MAHVLHLQVDYSIFEHRSNIPFECYTLVVQKCFRSAFMSSVCICMSLKQYNEYLSISIYIYNELTMPHMVMLGDPQYAGLSFAR